MSNKKLTPFERARRAKPRTSHYDIPEVDYDESRRLAEALTTAKAAQRYAALSADDPTVTADTDAAVKAAEAAFNAAHLRVTFTALPAKDRDALANEHPDPAEGEEREGPDFLHHLAAACCDVGFTAEQWRQLWDEDWPHPEAIECRNAVIEVNTQPYSAGLSKG